MNELERLLYELLEERRGDSVVRDILEDHETTEDFLAVLGETAESLISDNFNMIFQFSLLKWVQILDEEETFEEDLEGIEESVEDFMAGDPDEVDVLQMKAMMDES